MMPFYVHDIIPILMYTITSDESENQYIAHYVRAPLHLLLLTSDVSKTELCLE